MKAWEIDREIIENAKPKILSENEQTWDAVQQLEENEDRKTKIMWYSEVPGSAAPERLMISAIQSMENRGMDISSVEKLIAPGLKAYEENDLVELNRITSRIFLELGRLKKNDASSYWDYNIYGNWNEFEKNCKFMEMKNYDIGSEDFENKIYAGWIGQICGGALGTALEGYTTENIRKVFGDIRGYVRKPNTFNDDITFELAFLKAYEVFGSKLSSENIAEEWVALLPFGWSAEDVALNNLKRGIYPPESGSLNNPFSEWIGAQMRGAICGMVAPGNPREAARLAWLDGVISHTNNGVIGEVFNSVLVALSFVETDVRKLLTNTINMLPSDSEYFSVVNEALLKCMVTDNWQDVWGYFEDKLKKYNWVHAYPNAAAEVIALWFGKGDFDETMHIIAMEGQDVDCNAAQIATALGIIGGIKAIKEEWRTPIGDDLSTYVRGMKFLKISEIAKLTVSAVRKDSHHPYV